MKIKWLFVFLTVSVLIIIIFVFLYNNTENSKRKINDNSSILDIKKHYNNYVITNKEATLFKQENDQYIEYGKINKEVPLSLEYVIINSNTKYFLINGLDLYIQYQDVEPIETFEMDDRYKNYINFNKNIVTKKTTTFYDEFDNYIYTINQSFDFKVIVMKDDKYGIEYNNQLFYIHSDNIEKIYDNDNSMSNKEKVRTLTYHFIYNPETTTCDQSICQTLSQFESHLKYIRENDYFTLKLNELEMYLNGEINIPEKSIVITIDDGTIFDISAIKLLEQYQSNATMFVITDISDNYDYLKSDYLDLESHTNHMHNPYECPGYGLQGGGILCLPEDKVLEDLKLSQDKLGGSTYFAYPFFDFNDRAISSLKKAGFKLAFIGQYNTDGYSYPNKTDKYKVPRKTIFSTTTMEEFLDYLE